MTKEALKLALEALEYASTGNRRPEIIDPAITAIKEALAHRTWVGLTDEEIKDCLGPEAARIPPGWRKVTQAIEAKLKEKNT